MTRFEALVSLNMAADIGTIRLARLLAYFGKPEDILKARQDKLTAVSGIGPAIAEKIASFKEEDLKKELESAKKQNIRIITTDDGEYPENLRQIPDPPIVLYIKGSLSAQDKFSVAIVGSRRASFYGLSCAEKFAADLSGKGLTVVSGMARGIDTYAHRGALKAGGRTIAVMGSGFKHIYPQENRRLAEQIAESAAVLSEFSLDTGPQKQNFPRRNRVISGLSLGVLVAEAARNSGALITADFALEQGREVFALPGEINSHTACGTNGLIKQGAKLVSSADDILEEFVLPLLGNRPDKGRIGAEREVALSEEEGRLYNLISGDSIYVDELIDKTGMDISKISAILLRLEMRKIVRQLPGKQFVRS